MSRLFAPLTIRDVVFRNRIWVAPLCQYSAVDGIPQPWHHVHLPPFAVGGAGLVMAEATAVSAHARTTPQDTGLWTDEQQDAWAPIAASIRAHGAVAGIQLSHGGRKSSMWSPLVAGKYGSVRAADGGWTPVGPSAIAYEGYTRPEALDLAGIDQVVADFAAAARRALAAGFQVLEIHAAHGYLVHEFLSPLSNRRTDDYGGSLANRARLLLRILDAVRAVAPDAPLFVRLSGSDWAAGGMPLAETVIVAGWAAEHGADLFDVSSGGLVANQRIPVSAGYQVGFAQAIRRETGALVSAVGLIVDGAQAEEILESGNVDAVMAGREWMRDPHFALRIATELGVEVPYWPLPYRMARLRTAAITLRRR